MLIEPKDVTLFYTLLLILGFVVAACAWAIRAIHPTKKELEDVIKMLEKKLDDYQKKVLCTSKHDFGNQTMTEIKAAQGVMFTKLDDLTKIIIRYFGHEREKDSKDAS